jgi:hypothetical protein
MNFSASEMAVLREIASKFDCELIQQDDGPCIVLRLERVFSLYVRQDWRSQKAHVFPVPEGQIHRVGDSPSINVSLTRPAPALVRDIERRLLADSREWVRKCRDHTAKHRRGQRAEAAFLQRVFTANRTHQPEHWGHRGGWRGKGFEIGAHDARAGYRGEYVATVRVHSIETLEEIAAVCANDHEDHFSDDGKELAP